MSSGPYIFEFNLKFVGVSFHPQSQKPKVTGRRLKVESLQLMV